MNAISRKIIWSRFFDNLSINQIADRLEISPAAVFGHLQFTLWKLSVACKNKKQQ